MMYVITAQLASPSRNEEVIDSWIRSQFASWTNPLPAVWVVEGAIAAEQILNALAPSLSPDDRLLIIKAATEAVWHGVSDDSARWLADNFPGSITERVAGETEGLIE
jgi:hypothetical protein